MAMGNQDRNPQGNLCEEEDGFAKHKRKIKEEEARIF